MCVRGRASIVRAHEARGGGRPDGSRRGLLRVIRERRRGRIVSADDGEKKESAAAAVVVSETTLSPFAAGLISPREEQSLAGARSGVQIEPAGTKTNTPFIPFVLFSGCNAQLSGFSPPSGGQSLK